MTRRVLLVEIGTPAELPVVTPPAPRPPSSWAPELPPPAVLPPPSGLSSTSVADGALLEWTPSPAEGARSIVEAAVDNDGAPGMWREVRRVDSGLYMLSISEGKRWARVRAELNGRMSAPTSPVLCTPISVADAIEDIGDLEQSVEDVLAEQIALQAKIDQEIADRIAEDLRIAGEAAADATAKANAALATAQAAVDALAAEIGEIVNAPEWDAGETYAAGWLVQYNGHLYRAIVETTGDQPDTSPDEWELIGEYASLGEAVAAALTLATQTASELEAEVTRIDAMVARMPTGTGDLATEAMVLAEAQALATEIAAEAGRIDAVVSRMPGGSGVLATAASVSSEAATRADADSALGARIDVTRASIGQSVLLNNPDFELAEAGWQQDAFALGTDLPLPSNVDIYSGDGGLVHTGTRALRVSPPAAATVTRVYNSNRFSAGPGDSVSGSIRMRTHYSSPPPADTRVFFGVRWYNASNGYNADAALGEHVFDGSDNYFYGFPPLAGEATAPAGTAYGRFMIHVSADFQGAPGPLYFDAAMASRGGAVATASDLSLVQTEVSQQGDTLTAHAQRLDTQQTEIEGKANTTYVQSVEGIATAAQGQASANLSAINGMSATVGDNTASINELREVSVSSAAGNAIVNASFENTGTGRGWGTNSDGTGSLNGYYFATAAARSGGHVFRFNAAANLNNAGLMAVPASRQIRVGFHSRHVGGVAPTSYIRFTVRGYDAQMNQVLFTAVGGSATRAGGGAYDTTYRKNERVYTVPSDVVYIRGVLQTTTGDWSGNWMVDDVFMEPVSDLDTTMMARHTVALNVNGHVSGTVSENDGESSSFSILATVFRVISGPTAGIEWQNGYLRAYALGAQIVLGSNFGSGSDLMLWCGPNVGANSCTKANGLFWVDNTGDGYFAGRVLQGVLRWFNSTDSTSSTASVTTGSNPRLGKSVSLAVRYQFSEFWVYTGGTVSPAGGTTQATIVIERRYGSGSWTNLLTRSIPGTGEAYNPSGGGSDPRSWSININDQIYATDSANTTDSEYRARITSRSTQSHSPGTGGQPVVPTQYLSIEAME